MTLETLITLRVIGVAVFFRNIWLVFDFIVMVLTVISIGYGLKHIGQKGEICEADVPVLMLRFVLQPIRVLAAFASTCRIRQMQDEVIELDVDFSMLPAEQTQSSYPMTPFTRRSGFVET